MKLVAKQYERRGILAINPKALFEAFLVDEESSGRANTECGECVIVDIRGPLENHVHPWCDSYESIIQRVRDACATGCKAVVLRIDSPGGDVTGVFESAAAVRDIAAAAGKQLHAFAQGECASAAYAFASQCQTITVSLTALIGSIGVLFTRPDISDLNTRNGIRTFFIASGARKADGHPELPMSDAELANSQAIVDSMGDVFFELVSQGRGLRPIAVEQLQARVFHGDSAVSAGLADAVGSLTDVLASVAGFGGDKPMAKKMSYEEVRAVLAEAAEGDDPNAAAAKRALAAMDESGGGGDDKPADDKDKDKPPADDKGAAAADDEKAKAAKAAAAEEAARRAEAGGDDDKSAQSVAGAYRMALKAQTDAAELRAQLAARDERDERTQLIASRPDMAADMVSVLQKAPIALVREHVAGMAPLTPAAIAAAAAAAKGGGAKTFVNPRVAQLAATPALGKEQPNGESHLPAAEKAALDARMGIGIGELGIVSTDYKLQLGAYKPT